GFSAGTAVVGFLGRRLRTVGGTGTREAGRSTRRARHQFSRSSGSTASALFAPDSVTGQRRSEPSAVRTASAAVGARMWAFSFGPSRCSSCTLYQFIGTYLSLYESRTLFRDARTWSLRWVGTVPLESAKHGGKV